MESRNLLQSVFRHLFTEYRLVQKKGTVLLSTSLEWPAVAGLQPGSNFLSTAPFLLLNPIYSFKMMAAKEVLLIFVLTEIQFSLQQSSTTSATKYERVTVKSDSFNDIRTTNLLNTEYGLYRFLLLKRRTAKHIHTSSALLCASMCKTNVNCEGYYHEASQCHEAGASSLVGSSSKSSTTKDVYIDQTVYMNNKSK